MISQFIDNRDSVQFQAAFRSLYAKKQLGEAAELAVRLLKEQEPRLLSAKPDRERYEFILKNLKQVFPNIASHFSSDPQKVEKGLDKLGVHEGLGMHAIATKGQRVLAQDLQRREKVPPKSIQVCDNFAVFQEKLSAHFKDAKEGEKKLFLVRHRNNPKSLTRHTSPVFVWKHEGKFQLYLVDSGGGQKATNVIHDTLRSIQASNPPKGSEIHYDGGPGRLTDGNNCVILSFKEGVRMLRETETIDGWVRDHREQKGEGLFAITHLPPQFANLAQTFTYLRKYQEETGVDPLGERAKKHVYTGTDPKSGQEKPFNGKVAHTYLKFERRIIADCIANATEIREANFKKASLFTFLTPEG